jgi:hypothetical protein
VKQVSIGSGHKFQPSQIVCLEHETTRLYAEIIEFVEARQVCWVRPLLLAVAVADSEPLSVLSPEQLTLYDLRWGADLLWPASLFRPALDTEVIPLLVYLDDPDGRSTNDPDVHMQLSYFVRKVWQAYKSVF